MSTTRNLSGTTAIVTGASRGFGRATAVSLAARGARVIGVARSAGPLAELREQLGDAFISEPADVADPAAAADLIARYRPETIVLNAGATPPVGPLREQTWETFSTNWNVDVRHVFGFIREALTAPLDPGSVVIHLPAIRHRGHVFWLYFTRSPLHPRHRHEPPRRKKQYRRRRRRRTAL